VENGAVATAVSAVVGEPTVLDVSESCEEAEWDFKFNLYFGIDVNISNGVSAVHIRGSIKSVSAC
jgi:hypothetical protein